MKFRTTWSPLSTFEKYHQRLEAQNSWNSISKLQSKSSRSHLLSRTRALHAGQENFFISRLKSHFRKSPFKNYIPRRTYRGNFRGGRDHLRWRTSSAVLKSLRSVLFPLESHASISGLLQKMKAERVERAREGEKKKPGAGETFAELKLIS